MKAGWDVMTDVSVVETIEGETRGRVDQSGKYLQSKVEVLVSLYTGN
jgi:hypothetical protein